MDHFRYQGDLWSHNRFSGFPYTIACESSGDQFHMVIASVLGEF